MGGRVFLNLFLQPYIDSSTGLPLFSYVFAPGEPPSSSPKLVAQSGWYVAELVDGARRPTRYRARRPARRRARRRNSSPSSSPSSSPKLVAELPSSSPKLVAELVYGARRPACCRARRPARRRSSSPVARRPAPSSQPSSPLVAQSVQSGCSRHHIS